MIQRILMAVVPALIFGGVAALLMMHNTGTIATLSQEKGELAQRQAETTQALETAAQQAEMARKERDRAITSLQERAAASAKAIAHAQELQATVRRLSRENEELRAWADNYHPASVNSLLNTALAAPAAGHSDGNHIPAPTIGPGPEVRDDALRGTHKW